MKKKNLVMGILSTYPLYYIEPFFSSLKKSGYDGNIVIFTNNVDISVLNFLRSMHVKTISYVTAYPYLSDEYLESTIQKNDQHLSPNSLRYILYNAFLKANISLYDSVMISDIRDVYFQKDPFDFDYKTGITAFLEDRSMTIGTQPHNRYWIENGFGKSILHELFDKPISCSGITIGNTADMLNYFNKMIQHINSIKNILGLDQGIHNYLLHTGSIPNVHTYLDDEGPVSTISIFKPKQRVKIEAGKVIGLNGHVVNIVHQYDRNDHLLIRWNFKFYLRHKLNLLKGKLYFLKILIKKVIPL